MFYKNQQNVTLLFHLFIPFLPNFLVPHRLQVHRRPHRDKWDKKLFTLSINIITQHARLEYLEKTHECKLQTERPGSKPATFCLWSSSSNNYANLPPNTSPSFVKRSFLFLFSFSQIYLNDEHWQNIINSQRNFVLIWFIYIVWHQFITKVISGLCIRKAISSNYFKLNPLQTHSNYKTNI